MLCSLIHHVFDDLFLFNPSPKDLPTLEPAVCADPGFGTGIVSTCENKTLDAICWAYCDGAAGYTGAVVAK